DHDATQTGRDRPAEEVLCAPEQRARRSDATRRVDGGSPRPEPSVRDRLGHQPTATSSAAGTSARRASSMLSSLRHSSRRSAESHSVAPTPKRKMPPMPPEMM